MWTSTRHQGVHLPSCTASPTTPKAHTHQPTRPPRAGERMPDGSLEMPARVSRRNTVEMYSGYCKGGAPIQPTRHQCQTKVPSREHSGLRLECSESSNIQDERSPAASTIQETFHEAGEEPEPTLRTWRSPVTSEGTGREPRRVDKDIAGLEQTGNLSCKEKNTTKKNRRRRHRRKRHPQQKSGTGERVRSMTTIPEKCRRHEPTSPQPPPEFTDLSKTFFDQSKASEVDHLKNILDDTLRRILDGENRPNCEIRPSITAKTVNLKIVLIVCVCVCVCMCMCVCV